MRHFVLLFLVSFCLTVQAETEPYNQPRIPLEKIVTEIPGTAWESIKYSFRKEAVPAWAAIIGTSALTYHYDDDLYDGAKRTGRNWGLSNHDKTKTVLEGFGYDLVRLPSDTGSALYFLGDGWVHMGTAVAFIGTGYWGGSNRAYNTGVQMVHGMFVSTMFNQAIKRSTGRESPNQATEPRGKWRPFPSINAYNSHTSKYDAVPSGHIMTATLVFTVITENYPEYFWYVLPVEIAWLTALGFEMVNNGVHWASDYPLGIGMGYAVAKMSVKMGVKSKDAVAQRTQPNWMFFPSAGQDGPLMNARYSF